MPTKIEWAEESWNPITGCTPISEGCKNCYAKRMALRLKGRAGYPLDDPFRVTFHPDKLDQPLKWKKSRRIFVVSMGDLFHEDVSTQEIVKILWVTQEANHHIYLFLTKRPERMHRIFYELSITSDFNMKNLWLGVSVSNQADADRWIPVLLQIPAAKRFVSYEPALGPVDFTRRSNLKTAEAYKILSRYYDENGFEPTGSQPEKEMPHLDLIIAGGESGPGARPAHPDWFRSVRDDCAAAGVSFFFKQWGAWADWTDFENPRTSARGLNVNEMILEDKIMRRVGKKAAGRGRTK